MTDDQSARAHALELLDEIERMQRKVIGDLRAVLGALGDPPALLPYAERDLRSEPLATPAVMVPGDWIRLPDLRPHLWRQIRSIGFCPTCLEGTCHKVRFEPDGKVAHLRSRDVFPHLSEAQFDRDCDQERIDAARQAIADEEIRAERGAA
jgi:hypothetical protein